MTEIKTAQAWLVWTPRGNVYKTYAHTSGSGPASTVVIVHGLTEAEVHEAAELLEKSREALLKKSREVCETHQRRLKESPSYANTYQLGSELEDKYGITTIAQLTERLAHDGVPCPNCDNSGSYEAGTGWKPDDHSEVVQCEYCHSHPNSVYNKRKVAPDPRVAVLDRLGLLTLDQIEAVLVCAKAAVRASKTEGGIIITEDVTAVIDSIIAAQRGEVGQ